MIQSFKDCLEGQTQFLQKVENLDESSFHFAGSSFTIKLDSKNTIYRFRYSSNKDLQPYFEYLGYYIQDKNIDTLVESMAANIWTSLKEESFSVEQKSTLDNCLLILKRALLNAKGEPLLEAPESLSKDEIVCRCNKIDKDAFEHLYFEHKGVKRTILRNSNASLICGGCSPVVEKILKELDSQDHFFEGKETNFWKEKIQTSLESFPMFSPVEFDGVVVSLLETSFPEITLGVKLPVGNNLDLEKAKSTLSAYLRTETAMGFVLSLTVLE